MTPAEFKSERKRLGYSVAALAALWGKTPGAIHHWERGHSPIPIMAELALSHLTTLPPSPPADEAMEPGLDD